MTPAEAHQQREPITVDDVAEVVARFVGLDSVDLDTPLDDVGLDGDLERFRLWKFAAEEHAERTVTDIDEEDLLEARTVGDLADAIVRNLQRTGQTEDGQGIGSTKP